MHRAFTIRKKNIQADQEYCIFCNKIILKAHREYHAQRQHFDIWFAICFKWRHIDPIKYRYALSQKQLREEQTTITTTTTTI